MDLSRRLGLFKENCFLKWVWELGLSDANHIESCLSTVCCAKLESFWLQMPILAGFWSWVVKPYRLWPARIRTWYHEYTSDFAHLTFRGPVRVPRDCDLILKALCSLVIYLHAPQKQQFLTRRVSLKSYYCQNQVMPGLKITSCYVSEIGAYTDYLNSALSYKLIAKTSKVPIVPGPNRTGLTVSIN